MGKSYLPDIDVTAASLAKASGEAGWRRMHHRFVDARHESLIDPTHLPREGAGSRVTAIRCSSSYRRRSSSASWAVAQRGDCVIECVEVSASVIEQREDVGDYLVSFD